MWKSNFLVTLSMSVLLTACLGGSKGGSSGNDGRSVKMRLIDAPVAGVEYINPDGNRDITQADGSFYCMEDQASVQFFIGGINLGSVACEANAHVYPMDLLPEAPGVTRQNFDSSSLSARAALLILSINAYDHQLNKPELYTVDGTLAAPQGRGPSELVVTADHRTMLAGVTEAVFTDDVAYLELINKVRCSFGAGENDLSIIDLTNQWTDSNGIVRAAGFCATTNLDNFGVPGANSIDQALIGAVYHMEKSLYDNSGIIANGYTP